MNASCPEDVTGNGLGSVPGFSRGVLDLAMDLSRDCSVSISLKIRNVTGLRRQILNASIEEFLITAVSKINNHSALRLSTSFLRLAQSSTHLAMFLAVPQIIPKFWCFPIPCFWDSHPRAEAFRIFIF